MITSWYHMQHLWYVITSLYHMQHICGMKLPAYFIMSWFENRTSIYVVKYCGECLKGLWKTMEYIILNYKLYIPSRLALQNIRGSVSSKHTHCVQLTGRREIILELKICCFNRGWSKFRRIKRNWNTILSDFTYSILKHQVSLLLILLCFTCSFLVTCFNDLYT